MKPTKITNTKPRHEPNRLGDMAEHYAITWLWDNGYHVFKNCGCTGPIDIVALDPQGKVTLIDVKSYKDGRLAAKTPLQKKLNVQYLHYNSLTRKCRFVRHRT
jgi:Holliday junction resolvase-like predicted endonuclease